MPLIRKPSGPAPAVPTAVTPAPAVAQAPSDPFHLLTYGSVDERWAAARSAAGLPGGVQALQQALAHEGSRRVREAMFTSLARIASPASVEAVLPLLRSEDAQVRVEALDALMAMKDAVWPYCPSLIRDGDPDVRILSCELARAIQGRDAARLLADLIDAEQEPNVCAAAVEVLAEIGDAEALPALEHCRQRFETTPFLVFSIKIAADRIRAQTTQPRA